MVPQKHPDSEQRSVALTIPELEQSKAAVLKPVGLRSLSSQLRIRHRQVHLVVLQRAEVDLQSGRCCSVPVVSGESRPISRYDQPASVSEPPTRR